MACGAGNVAIPAAAAGADVTGCRHRARAARARRGERLGRRRRGHWLEGDAEALPFDDASFDVVTSAVGVMFCASHERAAAELAPRLPPGRLDRADQLDARGPDRLDVRRPRPRTRRRRRPGAKPGSLWGTEEHVSDLLGDGVDELCYERRQILFEGLAPDGFVDLMRASYGPSCASSTGSPTTRRAPTSSTPRCAATCAAATRASPARRAWSRSTSSRSRGGDSRASRRSVLRYRAPPWPRPRGRSVAPRARSPAVGETGLRQRQAGQPVVLRAREATHADRADATPAVERRNASLEEREVRVEARALDGSSLTFSARSRVERASLRAAV